MHMAQCTCMAQSMSSDPNHSHTLPHPTLQHSNALGAPPPLRPPPPMTAGPLNPPPPPAMEQPLPDGAGRVLAGVGWSSKADMPQKWVQCSQCEQWRRVCRIYCCELCLLLLTVWCVIMGWCAWLFVRCCLSTLVFHCPCTMCSDYA